MFFFKAIPSIERAIGYKFEDKSLLVQAFTRTSFCNEAGANGEYQSNEVLEFIGDSVLSTAIVTKLLSELGTRYAHGLKTNLGEGDFSNIKSNLSNKKNLSESMKALGLQKHLIMGEGDAKLKIENEPSVMEDLFESIIGAVYLDCKMNVEVVMATVAKMLDVSAYTAGEAVNRSAKNALQEWCADKSRKLPVPRYETLSEDGPDHKKSFVRACYVGDELVGRGIGKNFKIADAEAARAALEYLAEKERRAKEAVASKNEKKENSTSKKTAKELSAVSIPTEIDQSAPNELREHAAKFKLPSPQFKDLGDVAGSQNGKVIYRIECRLGEKSAFADAYSKTDARALAAGRLLDILMPKKQKPTAQRSKAKLGEKQNQKNKNNAKAK